jgi:chromosome segregation ATPase
MEMDELLISTGVDSLIRLIKEKKRIELTMVSKLLNLPASTIEDWAHILEEEGIIKIDYQLTKVYFVWAEATVDEIERERGVFTARKGAVSEQVKKAQGVQEEGAKDLQAYAADMEKISSMFSQKFARLEQLSVQLDETSKKRGTSTKVSEEKLDALFSKISEVESSMKQLTTQLKEAGGVFEHEGIEEKMAGIKKAKENMKELDSKVNLLMKKVEEARAKAPKEGSVELGSMKSDFEGMRREFAKMREESEYINSVISEFKINAETVRDALGHITELGKHADENRSRFQEELTQLEKIKGDLPVLEKRIKEDLAVADQYSETISVAQEVLQNVPPKEEVLSRLSEIDKEEKRIATEFRRFEATLSGASGNALALGDLIDELEDMKEEVESARRQLSEEADEILSAIEEETATYETFQKIKAKTKSSIDAYLAQLAKIREDGKQIKGELTLLREETSKKMEELVSSVSPASAKEATALLTELKAKKADLDRIRAIIADLNARSMMIEKNIRLLSKEAQLIELREASLSVGAAPPKGEEKGAKGAKPSIPTPGSKEAKEKAALSKDEQEEFELKRKELKDLIRKLWESE